MISTVYGYDCSKWVAERTPYTNGSYKDGYCITFVDNDKRKIVAGAVFHTFSKYNVFVDFALDEPKATNRRCVGDFFYYPFEICGCRRVSAIVAVDNARSIRFVEKLGFTKEGYIRNLFGDVDACLYGILREEADKWIRSATCRPAKKYTIAA